jgi:hypothetical protein
MKGKLDLDHGSAIQELKVSGLRVRRNRLRKPLQ